MANQQGNCQWNAGMLEKLFGSIFDYKTGVPDTQADESGMCRFIRTKLAGSNLPGADVFGPQQYSLGDECVALTAEAGLLWQQQLLRERRQMEKGCTIIQAKLSQLWLAYATGGVDALKKAGGGATDHWCDILSDLISAQTNSDAALSCGIAIPRKNKGEKEASIQNADDEERSIEGEGLEKDPGWGSSVPRSNKTAAMSPPDRKKTKTIVAEDDVMQDADNERRDCAMRNTADALQGLAASLVTVAEAIKSFAMPVEASVEHYSENEWDSPPTKFQPDLPDYYKLNK